MEILSVTNVENENSESGLFYFNKSGLRFF